MTMTIGFLHTAEAHTARFTHLVDEISPGTASRHVVDSTLLDDAREQGGVDDALRARLVDRLREAAEGADVVVCTCSTVSGPAELLSAQVGVPVIRIDRPMAELAVRTGPRIAVVAALESTIAPTVGLLEEIAAGTDTDITIDVVVCAPAWARFERGDLAGYASAIAESVDAIDPQPDVVMLAQASMADAVDLCRTAVPMLSSPRSAVDAAVRLTRRP